MTANHRDNPNLRYVHQDHTRFPIYLLAYIRGDAMLSTEPNVNRYREPWLAARDAFAIERTGGTIVAFVDASIGWDVGDGLGRLRNEQRELERFAIANGSARP